MHADGDTVIVVWDGRGMANDGRPYENSYAWFMRMSDGKVVDGTAFYDSISFNDLWARVQPASDIGGARIPHETASAGAARLAGPDDS